MFSGRRPGFSRYSKVPRTRSHSSTTPITNSSASTRRSAAPCWRHCRKRGSGFDALLDGVLQTGEPFVGPELPIFLTRTPGAAPEERFVDLVYLPLVSPDGARTGVIAHGVDITDHVRDRRAVERLLADSDAALRAELEAANEELQCATEELEERTAEAERARCAVEAAERQLQTVFAQSPALVAVTEGPEHRCVLANPGVEAAMGRGGLVGRTLLEALPEMETQALLAVLDRVYATGEPFVAHEQRVVVEREAGPHEGWWTFVYQTLVDVAGVVTGILHHADEVATHVRARQELETVAASLQTAEAPSGSLRKLPSSARGIWMWRRAARGALSGITKSSATPRGAPSGRTPTSSRMCTWTTAPWLTHASGAR